VLVEVTALDVELGSPNLCGFCPLARALQRTTGVPWLVHEDKARPLLGPHECVPLPPEACAFVKAFDAGERVEPLSFQFDYTPPGERP
jgi:hypothetical protein